MKVLFVYRGYGEKLTNSSIDFQRLSFNGQGMEVVSFPIAKGGIGGYLQSLRRLRKFIRLQPVAVVHAHYSISGFIARLATKRPVICSLMGSDLLQVGGFMRLLTRFFYRWLWNVTIVKSEEMQNLLPRAHLVPNGVDLANFREIPRSEAMQKTGFDPMYKHIIFVAQNPASTVKNFAIAEAGVGLLDNPAVHLHVISNQPLAELPYYYAAADLLLLTSFSEGSPNVIKEAMACNCPIVSTAVGDVREVLAQTSGTYICAPEARDVAEKIRQALDFGKRTNGREKILHLDSHTIAQKFLVIYQSIADA